MISLLSLKKELIYASQLTMPPQKKDSIVNNTSVIDWLFFLFFFCNTASCFHTICYMWITTHNFLIWQVSGKEHVQQSVRQPVPHVSQPNIFLSPPLTLCGHLHGLPQLPAQLWPAAHVLSATHTTSTRGITLDGAVQHMSHYQSPQEPSHRLGFVCVVLF